LGEQPVCYIQLQVLAEWGVTLRTLQIQHLPEEILCSCDGVNVLRCVLFVVNVVHLGWLIPSEMVIGPTLHYSFSLLYKRL
jgi:hypothetical protein